MSENSKIEWTHHTFNPWRGCTKVSPGCANCYADAMSGRNPKTLGVWGPNGTRVVAAESYWRQPLKWDRDAKAAGERRRRVFCASLADVFEDWRGPMHLPNGDIAAVEVAGGGMMKATMRDVRRRLLDLIYKTPNLDWLLLTKRPENAARMMGPEGVGLYAHANGPVPCPQPNLWLGTSVEDQQRADERIPYLLRCPAAVRFLSCEPLLGPVDLRMGQSEGLPTTAEPCRERADLLHWIIVGGESGPGARPCRVAWVRAVVSQCKAAGVACFVKQLGANPAGDDFPPEHPDPVTGVRTLRVRQVVTINDRKGGAMEEWPADIRVRQFPA